MSSKTLFVRKGAGKSYTADLEIDVDTVQALRLLARGNKVSEKRLCQVALAIFAETIFNGADLAQFHAATRAKIAKPRLKRFYSPAQVLARVMADVIKDGGNIMPEFKFAGLRIRKEAVKLAQRELSKR